MSLWICSHCNKIARPRTSNICPNCGAPCERVLKMERKKFRYINVKQVIESDKGLSDLEALHLAEEVLDCYKQGYIPVLDFARVEFCVGSFMGGLMRYLKQKVSYSELQSLQIRNSTNLVETLFNSAKNFGLQLYDENVAKALEETMAEMFPEE